MKARLTISASIAWARLENSTKAIFFSDLRHKTALDNNFTGEMSDVVSFTAVADNLLDHFDGHRFWLFAGADAGTLAELPDLGIGDVISEPGDVQHRVGCADVLVVARVRTAETMQPTAGVVVSQVGRSPLARHDNVAVLGAVTANLTSVQGNTIKML